ncbi:hypothetical protein [Flindersiella endophytica]
MTADGDEAARPAAAEASPPDGWVIDFHAVGGLARAGVVPAQRVGVDNDPRGPATPLHPQLP